MIRRCLWGILPVALAIVPASRLLADPPKPDPALATFQRFQSGPNITPAVAEKPKSKPSESEVEAKETAAALLAQEEANLLRRLAVCDRLMQLARDAGDAKLEEEVLRLEQRANEVFKERTRALPAAKPKAKEGGAKS